MSYSTKMDYFDQMGQYSFQDSALTLSGCVLSVATVRNVASKKYRKGGLGFCIDHKHLFKSNGNCFRCWY